MLLLINLDGHGGRKTKKMGRIRRKGLSVACCSVQAPFLDNNLGSDGDFVTTVTNF